MWENEKNEIIGLELLFFVMTDKGSAPGTSI